MKLLAYTISGQTIGIDIGVWNDAMLSGNTAFQAITDTGSTPSNYVDISTTVNWGDFGGMTTLGDAEIKSEIVKLIPDVPSAQEYEILEGYMNVGINSMTNIDDNYTLSNLSTDGYLSGVTDTKLPRTGSTSTNLVVDHLLARRIVKVNSEAPQMDLRETQEGALPPNKIAGMVVLEPTGVVGSKFLMGVDNTGVMKVGWSGSTLQPVVTGGSAGVTAYSTKNAGGTTTTSPTDVLMTGAQINSVPAGDYFLSFGTSMSHSSANSIIRTTIYIEGVAVTGSIMTWKRGGGQGNVQSTHNYAGYPVTLTGTSTVEIRWQTTAATATSTNRYLTLFKVG